MKTKALVIKIAEKVLYALYITKKWNALVLRVGVLYGWRNI